MINLHERMLSTSAGVEPTTSWSPVGRRIQLSHRGLFRYRPIKEPQSYYFNTLRFSWSDFNGPSGLQFRRFGPSCLLKLGRLGPSCPGPTCLWAELSWPTIITREKNIYKIIFGTCIAVLTPSICRQAHYSGVVLFCCALQVSYMTLVLSLFVPSLFFSCCLLKN